MFHVLVQHKAEWFLCRTAILFYYKLHCCFEAWLSQGTSHIAVVLTRYFFKEMVYLVCLNCEIHLNENIDSQKLNFYLSKGLAKLLTLPSNCEIESESTDFMRNLKMPNSIGIYFST